MSFRVSSIASSTRPKLTTVLLWRSSASSRRFVVWSFSTCTRAALASFAALAAIAAARLACPFDRVTRAASTPSAATITVPTVVTRAASTVSLT